MQIIKKRTKIPIKDLYNITEQINGKTEHQKEAVRPVGLCAIKNHLGYSQPELIIRHKTSKSKFKISSATSDVIITGDHSIMIVREGEMVESKPTELSIGDSIVVNDKIAAVTSIEQLGNFENEYVYDVSMNTNNTFYANDILVHNTDSVYFSVEDIVDDLISRNLMPQKYIDDTTQFCLDIVDLRLNDYIDEAYDRFAAKFGTVNIQKFELENILYNTIFVAKKKYVGDIAWKEGGGKSERNKKLKITGIEIIQSSTPKFARETLQDLVKYIFENVNNFSQADLIAKLNKIKNEFKMQPIEDISYSRSIGDYEKFILEDKSEFKINGGCPIHVRGAGYHNYLLNTNEEYKNKYKRIKTSDKIKFYYATDPVCNSFSYLAGNYPYEVAPEMDIDLQFEKSIIDPINRLLIPFGVGAVRPNLVTTRALF